MLIKKNGFLFQTITFEVKPTACKPAKEQKFLERPTVSTKYISVFPL